jgi:hypothetical protein
MATNRKIETTELDFDGIKQNLKNYLQGQSQFTDYDFEGSAMSTLIDLLAYNTHYNALYTNLAINEAFLDSASKRSSVVSKAKELGYVPTSSRAATATVDITFINDQLNAPAVIAVPAFTPFSTSVNGDTYLFYNTQAHLAYRNGNQYVLTNVVIKEGTPLSFRFLINEGTKVIIPNENVDTNTVRVIVQDNAQSSTTRVYNQASSLLDLSADSRVYFLKELENGQYEVEFGNGVIGKNLDVGNVVTVEYMVCSQDAANGARLFQYGGNVNPNTEVFVTTVDPAFGGSFPETIESIKWNAPRNYNSQNRCVTLDDFKNIIFSQYPNAQSINVWGGENNNPPSYGDVYISIKPVDQLTLSDGEKAFILNEILAKRKLVTVHPKLVDPTYLNLELNVTYYYNPSNTTRTANDISQLIRDSILDYNSSNLNRFGEVFKYSSMSRIIDSAEDSIVSNITTVKIHRDVPIIYNEAAEYSIDLGNPIYNPRINVAGESIISSAINVINVPQLCYIDDVPSGDSQFGTLRLFFIEAGKKRVLKNIGTVDYTKGIITISGLIITGAASSTFKLIVKPQSNDVPSARNQIVNISDPLLTILPIIEGTADSYKFASSRN